MATWAEMSASLNACMDAVFDVQSSAKVPDVVTACAHVLDALHDEQVAVTRKAIEEDDGDWVAQTAYFSATATRLKSLSAKLQEDVGYIASAGKAIDAIAALLAKAAI